jgi:hypothetical protein
MNCPHCGEAMTPGRAENRRPSTNWMPVQINPHCWFVPDDGSTDAAVVPSRSPLRAFRCGKCRTVVVIGSEEP